MTTARLSLILCLLAARRNRRTGSFEAVNVVANGTPTQLPDGATLGDLLHVLGLGSKWVVAERNGEPVGRRDMARTRLADGDRIELVRAVAGG